MTTSLPIDAQSRKLSSGLDHRGDYGTRIILVPIQGLGQRNVNIAPVEPLTTV